MKTILSDASSAILLSKCGLFQELTETYQVIMAQAVYEEVTREGYLSAEEFREYRIRDRITVRPLNEGTEAAPFLRGRGERDTICQYLSGTGEFILIDDKKGAGYCRDKGIPYINALLLPRILFMARKISRYESRCKTAAIIRIGRYSEKIIAYAMNCPRQNLEFFLP